MTVAAARTVVVYASFWRRAGAVIIDSIVLSMLSAGLLYLLYGPSYFVWLQDSGEVFGSFGMGEILVDYGLPVLLLAGGWRYFGASPGKFLFGCQVVDAHSFGRVTWGQALLRYVCYLISALPLGLGFWWVLWDKRNQGFHDKIAGTVVIVEDESARSLADLEREFRT